MYVCAYVRTYVTPTHDARGCRRADCMEFDFFSAVGYIKGKQYDSSSETKARPALGVLRTHCWW